jgi:hypothetical protein
MRENSCKNWSQGLRFVQFQKNSCHHRILQHSPYSVLFGTEPKVGLASTSLHPLIFNNITTEEQLDDELNATKNNLHLTDQDECESEVEEEHSIDSGKQYDNEQNDIEQHHDEQPIEHSNIIINEAPSPLNNRITKTDAIRRQAYEGQKRQAEQFLQSTIKKQKLINFNVGDNVVSNQTLTFHSLKYQELLV